LEIGEPGISPVEKRATFKEGFKDGNSCKTPDIPGVSEGSFSAGFADAGLLFALFGGACKDCNGEAIG
jgi:hypothetical protein